MCLLAFSNGGRYVCISLLQEHILNFLLEFMPRNNCMLRIVHCLGVEQANKEKSSDDALTMPVFVVIATKFKSLPMPVSENTYFIIYKLNVVITCSSLSLASAATRCSDSAHRQSSSMPFPRCKRQL